MTSLQDKIDALDAEITSLNNDISTLQGMTGTNIQDCIDMQIEKKQEQVTQKTGNRDEYQSKKDDLDYTWTTPEQTYVDDISTTFSGAYDKYMSGLKRNSTLKTNVFNEYANATDTTEKQIVLDAMLGL